MPISSPFEMLLEDLAEMQAQRTSRDAASRSARHAAESARNRRMARPQPQRPLKKSAPPPDYRKPDWDGLAARQERIAAGMEQSRVQQQKDAIREHLRLLAVAARAGRLTAHQACLLDVYRGQALRMGINP